MNENNINNIKLIAAPQFRHNVMSAFKSLADAEYQTKEWRRPGYDGKPYIGRYMPYIIHALYDDYGDLEDLEVCLNNIDHFFYDEEEARLAHDLCYFIINEVDIDVYGSYPEDIDYLNHSKWPEVVSKAAKVYELMKANNEKYNFADCHEMFCTESYEDWMKRFS